MASARDPIPGRDGGEYLSISGVAQRLRTGEDRVHSLIASGQLPAHPTAMVIDEAALRHRRGRRPQCLVSVKDVDLYRQKARDVNYAGEEEGAPELLALAMQLARRVDELEVANATLRGEVSSLKEALALSLTIDTGRIEQLRQFIVPSTMNHE
jgi:hypothetical protein